MNSHCLDKRRGQHRLRTSTLIILVPATIILIFQGILLEAPVAAADENVLVIWLVSSETDTEFFPPGIALETDTQTMIRWIPKRDEALVVDSNFSPSYAQSTSRPYTFDDRFFIINAWGLDRTGHHDVEEFNPMTDEKILGVDVRDPVSINVSAVVNDHYFYRKYNGWDFMYGYFGGELKDMQFTDGAMGVGDVLLDSNHPDRNFDLLDASNGNLYSAHYNEISNASDQLVFKRHNQTTGEADLTRTITIADETDYDNYRFAFDGNNVYWCRMRKSDNLVEIWRYDVIAGSGQAQVYSGVLQNVDNVHFMDADDGHVVLGDQDGYVFILDTNSGEKTLYDLLGFKYYDLAVMYTTYVDQTADFNGKYCGSSPEWSLDLDSGTITGMFCTDSENFTGSADGYGNYTFVSNQRVCKGQIGSTGELSGTCTMGDGTSLNITGTKDANCSCGETGGGGGSGGGGGGGCFSIAIFE